jgi:hypothetical protein
MIDLGFLGIWEESIRHAKENRQEQFGGIVAVLMFDHCQLRTVKGAPIYKTSTGDKPLTPIQDRGRHVYRHIKKAIYLTVNMRFVREVEWGEWLDSARLGFWPEALRAFLTTDFSLDQSAPLRGFIQTISTDNLTRMSINETAIHLAVQSLPDSRDSRKVYVVPARLSRRLSPNEQTLFRGLPDNKTGNIPLSAHLYVGTSQFPIYLITLAFSPFRLGMQSESSLTNVAAKVL